MVLHISERRKHEVVFELSNSRVDALNGINNDFILKDDFSVIEGVAGRNQFICGRVPNSVASLQPIWVLLYS